MHVPSKVVVREALEILLVRVYVMGWEWRETAILLFSWIHTDRISINTAGKELRYFFLTAITVFPHVPRRI